MITALTKAAYPGDEGSGLTFARADDKQVRVGIYFDGGERMIVFLPITQIRAALDGPVDADPVQKPWMVVTAGCERGDG